MRILLLSVLVIGFLPNILYCQTTEEISQQIIEDRLYKNSYSPQGSTSLVNTFSQVNLTSSFGDEFASATFGIKSKQFAGSVFIKQPFEEKPKKVTPLTLEGLDDGASIEFAFQYTFWEPKVSPQAVTTYGFNQEVDFASLNREQKKELDNASFKKSNPILIGLALSFGKSNYDYITDSTDLTPEEFAGVNRNLRFSVGRLFSGTSILVFSILNQKKFLTGETSNISFPNGSNGSLFNRDVIIGNPKKTNETIFTFEFRKSFESSEGTPLLAIAPALNYLNKAEKISLEIPVYFLNYKEDGKISGLQGGVSVGYLTGSNELDKFSEGFAASIFIATPFDLKSLFKTK